MRLSAPKQFTWWIAVILGALGILLQLGVIGAAGLPAFWVVVVAFVLLVLGTLFKGL